MTSATEQEGRHGPVESAAAPGRIGHPAGDFEPRRASKSGARPFRLKQWEASEWQHQISLVKILHRWAHKDCLWQAIINQQDGGARRGFFLKQMGMRPGAADMLFVMRGSVLLLELKKQSGGQSESQRAYEALAKCAGAEYFVSYRLEDSLNLLWARSILTRDLVRYE